MLGWSGGFLSGAVSCWKDEYEGHWEFSNSDTTVIHPFVGCKLRSALLLKPKRVLPRKGGGVVALEEEDDDHRRHHNHRRILEDVMYASTLDEIEGPLNHATAAGTFFPIIPPPPSLGEDKIVVASSSLKTTTTKRRRLVKDGVRPVVLTLDVPKNAPCIVHEPKRKVAGGSSSSPSVLFLRCASSSLSNQFGLTIHPREEDEGCVFV